MKTKMMMERLPKDLVDRLKLLRRPHQSIAGVIEELLSKYSINPQPNVQKETKTVVAQPDEITIPLEAEHYADDHVAPIPEGAISIKKAVEMVQSTTKKTIKESDILRWAKQGKIKVYLKNNGEYLADRDSMDYFIDNYSIK